MIDKNIYEELPDWPKIPENLLPSMSDIQNMQNTSPITGYTNFQQFVFKIPEIENIIKDYINFDIKGKTYFQVVKNEIPIHVDKGRDIIYNYLFSTGGKEVYTVFYENDKTTEKFRVKIPLHTWHKMDVSNYHTVLGLEDVRAAITIHEILTVKRPAEINNYADGRVGKKITQHNRK